MSQQSHDPPAQPAGAVGMTDDVTLAEKTADDLAADIADALYTWDDTRVDIDNIEAEVDITTTPATAYVRFTLCDGRTFVAVIKEGSTP